MGYATQGENGVFPLITCSIKSEDAGTPNSVDVTLMRAGTAGCKSQRCNLQIASVPLRNNQIAAEKNRGFQALSCMPAGFSGGIAIAPVDCKGVQDMQIIRERPCQRRHHRVTAPLVVSFADSAPQQAADWGIGGLRLDGFAGTLPKVGDVLAVSLELPFQGFNISFEEEVEVLRVDEEAASFACTFPALSERGHDLLRHFLDDLIRGKMATVDDTICRIDVPVTPISTQPDPNPTGEIGLSRWPLKTIVMTGLYLMLGLGIFGYSAALIYSNTTQLEVKTAVVSAPLQVLNMPVDGVVQPILLQEGMPVRMGQELARIEDTKLTARIQEARIRSREARDNLRRAQKQYDIEAERLKLYQIVSQVDHDTASAQVEARREALKAADGHLQRIQPLWKKGYATRAQWEGAKERQMKAAAALREAEANLELATTMNSASKRRHYNHKEFVNDLDVLMLEIDELGGAYEVAESRLELLLDAEKALVVRAPFNGYIAKVFSLGGQALARNGPIALVRKEAPATVTAYLKQDEVLRVGMNDTASVYLPALNRYVPAQVVRIDRSATGVDLKNAEYEWKGPEERSAAVSLRLLEEQQGDAAQILPGLPAIVVFQKRSTSTMYARIAHAE